MRITDDGIGFETKEALSKISFGGNGLFNMNKRAKEIGGQLTIDSTPGKGSSIELYVPL